MQKTSSLIKTLSPLLLILIFFLIPIEHKYDKLFHYYSLSLIPTGFSLPKTYNPNIYFYISDLIGLIFFGLGIWQVRKRYTEHGATFLALLFGLALLSIICSSAANYPVLYTRLLQLFTPLALFFFLAHNPLPKEHLLKIVCGSLFAASLIQAIVAICQYFAQHSLGLRFFGEQPLVATIFVPDGHRWIFDQWMHRIAPTNYVFRAMGTMPHPNSLGGLFAVCLLITQYFFYRLPKHRFWLAAAYLIQLFALGITYSRSALFAYIIGTMIWFGWMKWRQGIVLKSSALLILISSAFVGTLLYEQIIYRGGIVNYADLARSADRERLFFQGFAYRMIEKHPLTGVGYGQFGIQSVHFSPHDAKQISASIPIAHNIYLMIAAETGLFALTAFLCWIGLILFAAWRATPFLPETGLLIGIFIGLLFIGGCDFYPLYFQQGTLLFFGIAGLLARFGCFNKKLATCSNDS